MSHDDNVSFTAQLTRIRAILGLRDEAALAEFLGVSPVAVDAARERGKLPAEWLLILLRVLAAECAGGQPVARFPAL